MDVREGKSTFGLDLRSYPQEESRSCLANLAKNSAVELMGSRGEPTIVTLLIDSIKLLSQNVFLCRTASRPPQRRIFVQWGVVNI